MPSVTVNGQTYQDFTDAFAGGVLYPTAGIYYALPPFGQPPRFGPMEKEKVKCSFPGQNGQGTKVFGDRQRPIWIDFVVVGTPAASLRSNLLSLFSTINDGGISRYSIALPGQTFAGCNYESLAGPPVFDNWLTNCQFMIPVLFLQLSTSN